MANEEIRGEQQDPNLIGISGPGSTLGLGGQSGVVPGMAGISPIAPPYIGGAQKVFDTLPIGGKRFSYDYVVLAGASVSASAVNVRTAIIPLLGPNINVLSTIFGALETTQAGPATAFSTYGGFITLVTGISFTTFADGIPISYIGTLYPTLSHTALEISGAVMPEYALNSMNSGGMRPLFIPMNSTDTLTLRKTILFTQLHFGALPPIYQMEMQITLEGILIPDNGNAKELQVSL
jgi:hypothetical protein